MGGFNGRYFFRRFPFDRSAPTDVYHFLQADRGRTIPSSAHTLGNAWPIRAVSVVPRRQSPLPGGDTAGTSGPSGDVQPCYEEDAKRPPSGRGWFVKGITTGFRHTTVSAQNSEVGYFDKPTFKNRMTSKLFADGSISVRRFSSLRPTSEARNTRTSGSTK